MIGGRIVIVNSNHLTAQGQEQLRRFKRLAAEHERHVAEKIGKENRERLRQILSCFT
jgi:DNA-binding PadR family transcriptional regulator